MSHPFLQGMAFCLSHCEMLCTISILRWRAPGIFPENPAKIQWIIIPHDVADLLHRISSNFQKLFCLVDADGGNVLQGCHAHVALKAADEPAHAHMAAAGVLLDGDFLGKGFVKIMDGRLHFFRVAVF